MLPMRVVNQLCRLLLHCRPCGRVDEHRFSSDDGTLAGELPNSCVDLVPAETGLQKRAVPRLSGMASDESGD
jgi:hypothetical protein